MRKRIVAGNWKMNKTHTEGAALAAAVVEGLRGKRPSCDVIVFPPFTAIPAVVQAVGRSEVAVGGQDLFYEDAGAFTGEVSGLMLRELGCTHVLVGHSERRHVIGEGGALLAKKLRAALRTGLVPIVCVGELLDEREGRRAASVVSTQLLEILEGLGVGEMEPVVVAYEPVWAIGTGRTATPADASEMHRVIRETLGRLFGDETAERTPVLYGGSVKPDNAAVLMGTEDVDGLLVGGASLEASSFLAIVRAS
jgi:triosephosphate isomerase